MLAIGRESARPRPGFGFKCTVCRYYVRENLETLPTCSAHGTLIWYESGEEFCDMYIHRNAEVSKETREKELEGEEEGKNEGDS